VIVAVADEVAAELIVMPTHGLRGIGHMFMGSVAERVVREAKRPVLTIRSGSALRLSQHRRWRHDKGCPNDSCRVDDAKPADRRTER
jgi:universal stress protein family protein